MASVGTLRPVGLRRRLTMALGSLRTAGISARNTLIKRTPQPFVHAQVLTDLHSIATPGLSCRGGDNDP